MRATTSVYTYNMPDALDARLASLSLSGVEIGEFDPGTTEYEGTPAEGVTETTVEASALQRRTDVAIDPPDADGNEANGPPGVPRRDRRDHGDGDLGRRDAVRRSTG